MSDANLNQPSQLGGSVLNQILNNIPTPQQPYNDHLFQAANVQFVLENGGGSGDQSLNEINNANPLNGVLDL